MSGKTKKTIFFSVLIVIAIAVGVGYYFYNKGLRNIENATPDASISAEALYQAYIADSVNANKKFSEKIIAVTGVVTNISQNQQNKAIILLKTNQADASVNCTLEGEAANAKEGDTLTVKGICNGLGAGDAELGILGDIYLIRGYLTK